MALAYNNGYPRVDVESLLFDLKDILRTSLQVNKAQTAEIVRLGGRPMNDVLAAEYEERVHVALDQVDAALDVLDGESFEAASTNYEFDVMAWIKNTNKELGLHFEHPPSPEAVPYRADVDPNAAPLADVPTDFWNVHDFKWEDEPLSDEGSNHPAQETPEYVDDGNSDVDSVSDMSDDDDDGLVPEEQIPEISLDADSDRSSSTPRAGSSNFDDSATLYHPDSEDSSSPFSHRRRHTLIASKLATLDYLPTLGKLASNHPIFASPHTSAPTPTRPFGLVRTSSAPDLRALRGPHDLLYEEEHMLLSSF